MTNLEMNSLIFFGFDISNIVELFLRTSLLASSFVGDVVDYNRVLVQLGMKIILLDIRHLLLTLTQLIL